MLRNETKTKLHKVNQTTDGRKIATLLQQSRWLPTSAQIRNSTQKWLEIRY